MTEPAHRDSAAQWGLGALAALLYLAVLITALLPATVPRAGLNQSCRPPVLDAFAENEQSPGCTERSRARLGVTALWLLLALPTGVAFLATCALHERRG